MICPSCRTKPGIRVDLKPDLEAIRCDQCGGNWISRKSYERWRTKLAGEIPEKAGTPCRIKPAADEKARLCPDCHKILLKYKVGHGVGFSVELCSTCGGIWLDKNEWETLEDRGLHDDLHRVFSPAWQKQVRDEDLQEAIEATYRAKLGPDTYAKAKEMKDWISLQGHKRLILTYLAEE